MSEIHLRQIMQPCPGYYNEMRTHRSLVKDASAFRAVQRIGGSIPLLLA
jgi:hypothetical protein